MPMPSPSPTQSMRSAPHRSEFPTANLRRFPRISARPLFAQRIAESDMARGVISVNEDSFESFLEKAVANSRLADAAGTRRRSRALHHRSFRTQPLLCRSAGSPSRAARRSAAAPAASARAEPASTPRAIAEGLRRFFRQQMVRIQSDSVYHRVSVFRTLQRTSDLAEAVINAAYAYRLAEPPAFRLRVSITHRRTR